MVNIESINTSGQVVNRRLSFPPDITHTHIHLLVETAPGHKIDLCVYETLNAPNLVIKAKLAL